MRRSASNHRLRELSVRLVLICASAVCPSFLSAKEATAPATPVALSTKCPVVWRGTFGFKAGRTVAFSITDSATGRSYWLSIGEKVGEISVTAYDKAHETLSLRVRGKDYRIRLATAVYENEPEPSLTPKFAKSSQIRIKGLDRLSRLTPARRRAVMQWLAASVAGFDEEFKKASEEAAASGSSGDDNPFDPSDFSLNLSVEVVDGPGTTASVVLGTHDFPGDGEEVRLKTMNFPGDAESPVAPADLFANDRAAYERLSALSLKGLKVPLREGLSPKAENFTNLMLTAEGIRVRFESGQANPGSFETGFVDIPASELDGVMSEDTLRLWKKTPAK